MAHFNHGEFVEACRADMSLPLWTNAWDAQITIRIARLLVGAFGEVLQERLVLAGYSTYYLPGHRVRINPAVSIVRFGDFYKMVRPAHTGRDPFRNIPLYIPLHYIPKFRCRVSFYTCPADVGMENQYLAQLIFEKVDIDLEIIRRFIKSFSKLIIQIVRNGDSVTVLHVGRFKPYTLVGRNVWQGSPPQLIYHPPKLKISFVPCRRLLVALL